MTDSSQTGMEFEVLLEQGNIITSLFIFDKFDVINEERAGIGGTV